jgi:hypothetical protein
MSIQYRLVQSGKTASGGCLAGQGSSELVAPQIIIIIIIIISFLIRMACAAHHSTIQVLTGKIMYHHCC